MTWNGVLLNSSEDIPETQPRRILNRNYYRYEEAHTAFKYSKDLPGAAVIQYLL